MSQTDSAIIQGNAVDESFTEISFEGISGLEIDSNHIKPTSSFCNDLCFSILASGVRSSALTNNDGIEDAPMSKFETS
jgi:hypothetical protein